MNAYRENARVAEDVNVLEMRVTLYVSSSDAGNSQKHYGPIRFKGTLTPSKVLPGIFISQSGEDLFNRWIVESKNGGYYVFDDPLNVGTDNGQPIMRYMIPFHAVVMLTTTKYPCRLPRPGGTVMSEYCHDVEVERSQHMANRGERWVAPAPKE